jgi:RNA polymerase sigma-70 factor (ECF subfamily)
VTAVSSGQDGVLVELFEQERPRLLGLAYRMLGVLADAEDVVQEAWLRWQSTDPARVRTPRGWLTTVTTRLSLDQLRTQRRRREEYLGPWLPEPIVMEAGPEDAAELSESLTLGFLTLLDRLGPVERAVFLLVEVFAVPYPEVSDIVGKSEVACRQIASRARRRLHGGPGRASSRAERKVVEELMRAVATGDVSAALARVAPDAVLVTDGGRKRRAARRPVVGADRIVRFLSNLARRSYEHAEVTAATVNGDPGLVVRLGGAVDLVAAFEVDNDRVAAIWMIRNPDKLEHTADPVVLI